MRPSELKGGITPPAPKLKFPVDDMADPPISTEEALRANGALCPRHGGMIGQRREKSGMVFLCTDCGQYWRFRKGERAAWRPVRYRSLGHV